MHFMTAIPNEDYIYTDVNLTFTSGQNATGDNQQCALIPILNDNILECNETFSVLLDAAVPEDRDVLNITAQIITVLLAEDNSDSKLLFSFQD